MTTENKKELEVFAEELLSELEAKISLWLKTNRPFGTIFRKLTKKETEPGRTNYSFDPKNEEPVYDWRQTVEKIFGIDLKSLECFFKHQDIFRSIFIDNPKSPPNYSGGENDITREICLIVADVMAHSFFRNSTEIYFENKLELVAVIVDYLLRDDDEFELIAPVAKLSLVEPVTFHFGEILPITWEESVELLKLKTDQVEFNFSSMGSKAWETTRCRTLMKLRYKVKRQKKNLIYPYELQRLQINLENILRLYCYGGPNIVWSHNFLIGISKRSVSSSTPGKSSTGSGDIKPLENSRELAHFIDKYLTINEDSNKEFDFVFDKLSEAWLSSRSVNFRVFDYISVIEALLVEANQGEFSFRISTLSAAFIGKNSEEKKAIYNLIKKAYTIRSKVAHCAKEIKESLTLEETEKLGFVAHEIMIFSFVNGVDTLRAEAFGRLLN